MCYIAAMSLTKRFYIAWTLVGYLAFTSAVVPGNTVPDMMTKIGFFCLAFASGVWATAIMGAMNPNEQESSDEQ